VPQEVSVSKTQLPGIGTQYRVSLKGGQTISVVTTRDGKRNIAVYEDDDPDACRPGIHLTAAEAAIVSRLLADED
jgi:TrkA domain protein